MHAYMSMYNVYCVLLSLCVAKNITINFCVLSCPAKTDFGWSPCQSWTRVLAPQNHGWWVGPPFLCLVAFCGFCVSLRWITAVVEVVDPKTESEWSLGTLKWVSRSMQPVEHKCWSLPFPSNLWPRKYLLCIFWGRVLGYPRGKEEGGSSCTSIGQALPWFCCDENDQVAIFILENCSN